MQTQVKFTSAFAGFAAVVVVCHPASAVETVVLNPIDRGHYTQFGSHSPSNTNYGVGQFTDGVGQIARNFFAYDLSGIEGTIIDAKLGYEFSSLLSPEGFEDYELYDVTTPIDQLLSGFAGEFAYDDLGTGELYGTHRFFNSQGLVPFEIQLTPAAITSLNNADDLWAIGGRISTLDGPLGFTQEFAIVNITQSPDFSTTPLILTIEIPAPGVLALLGAAGLCGRRRRR
jgi:hypothetical protein